MYFYVIVQTISCVLMVLIAAMYHNVQADEEETGEDTVIQTRRLSSFINGALTASLVSLINLFYILKPRKFL